LFQYRRFRLFLSLMTPLILIFSLCFTMPTTQDNDMVDFEISSDGFTYDILYATSHNFLGQKIYECSKCLLRTEVAEALIKANMYFYDLGYRIRLYDCYRPLDVQKKMWEIMPRATYLANPYERGSVHNRGAAVDLTLETVEGCFVD